MAVSTAFSLHDNSITEFRFVPETAQLHVVMADDIEGTNGQRSVVIEGVRSITVSGSISDGTVGFVPGDEVLTFEVRHLGDGAPASVAVRILINPLPQRTRPLVGLNVVEVVAETLRLA